MKILARITTLLITLLALQSTSAQELTMYSGFFDYQFYVDNQRITRPEAMKLLQQNQDVWRHWQQSRVHSAVAGVSAVGSIVLLAISIDQEVKNDELGPYYFGGLGALVVGSVFAVLSSNKKRDAILSYNETLERKTSFKLVPAKQGVGIALQF